MPHPRLAEDHRGPMPSNASSHARRIGFNRNAEPPQRRQRTVDITPTDGRRRPVPMAPTIKIRGSSGIPYRGIKTVDNETNNAPPKASAATYATNTVAWSAYPKIKANAAIRLSAMNAILMAGNHIKLSNENAAIAGDRLV